MQNELTIVTVDDTSFNLDLLDVLLGQLDLKAVRFTSPERALEYIKEFPVDILLTDYNMPVMNGIQLIEEARLHHPTLRTALITALRDEYGSLKNEALKKGANYFLTHPINFHEFQKCIEVVSQNTNLPLYCQKEKTMCINRDKVLTQGSVMCCRDEVDEERDIIIDVIDAIEDCHNNISTVMRCSSKLSYLSDIIHSCNDIELKESLPEIKKFANLIYDFSQKIQDDSDIRGLAMSFSNGLKDWFSHKYIKPSSFYNVSNFSQSLKADLSSLEMALGVCVIEPHSDDIDDLFF